MIISFNSKLETKKLKLYDYFLTEKKLASNLPDLYDCFFCKINFLYATKVLKLIFYFLLKIFLNKFFDNLIFFNFILYY